jgi:hypothetical protein
MLLLDLSTSVPEIQDLFERNAVDGRIRLGSWLRVARDQEHPSRGDTGVCRRIAACAATAATPAAVRHQLWCNDTSVCCDHAEDDPAASHNEEQLTLLQFSLHLLSPQNDAVTASHEGSMLAGKPLAHYWAASSHKYLCCDSNHSLCACGLCLTGSCTSLRGGI